MDVQEYLAQAGTAVATITVENDIKNQLQAAEQRVEDLKKLQRLLEATPALKECINLMGRLGIHRRF